MWGVFNLSNNDQFFSSSNCATEVEDITCSYCSSCCGEGYFGIGLSFSGTNPQNFNVTAPFIGSCSKISQTIYQPGYNNPLLKQ